MEPEPRIEGPGLRSAPGDLGRLVTAGRTALARERGLTVLGVAGLGISLVCLGGVAVHGRLVPPEGKMLDATTFTFGVAVFTLTVALLLPLAGYSPRARRRWLVAYWTFAAYGLVLEPLQAFRGRDPRFSLAGGPVDQIAGGVFGLTAVVLTVAFVVLGRRFFRSDVLADRPILRTGIRYGVVAVWLSFGVGIVMSIVAGREIGAAGDLMLTHALGVHGIQAVPLVALLLASRAPLARASVRVHAAGAAWVVACAAALAQSLAGRPPFEASALPAVTLVGLAVWAVVGSDALLARWRRPDSGRLAPPAPSG